MPIYETNNNDEMVLWLKQHNLIKTNAPHCDDVKCKGVQMKWSKKGKGADGYHWRCSKCGKSESIRNGSFFR